MAAVLSIGKLGASRDQLEYYERQVAAGIEDYYAGRGESSGRWIGGGCGGIGLAGRVDRDGFMRAMDGCDPGSGERLRPEHGRTRVAALDLTFSAPKSVSVLFAVGDEELSHALVEAHERAVAAAVGYLEREACFTRRGRNGVRRVRGEGFIGAAYRHRLSRAGDPQLHTHVVVANMTGAEGRWTSLEAHGIYEHKWAAGALYRAVLRAEVRERLPWVSWRPAGRGLFEIDGVPVAVLREFSRRRVEIDERALELAGVRASALPRERLQAITLATRRAKHYRVDGARWREEAGARAAEHGLGERELEWLRSAAPTVAGRSESDVIRVAAARLSGPEGLTANHNTFARRHALAEIAGEFTQGASVAQLERATSAYLDHGCVVLLGRLDDERRFTTRDLLACERAIVEGAARRVDETTGAVHPRLPDVELAGLANPLSDEQAAAAKALATDGQGVSVLRALAGTGKTRVLGALARIYEAADYRVIGVAPTGRAVRELADTAEIAASTMHRLLAELESGDELMPRTVVLFDEAGMAPTRLSAGLFAQAERAGAKVVVAGDSGQLPSVQAGGWFGAIGRELGGPELCEVMRQRDAAERTALGALHDDDADTYLWFKHQQGALAVHAREQDGHAALLDEWDQARAAHGLSEAVMISPNNATRVLLNEEARARLKRDRVLPARGIVIGGQEFCVGERVIARRNDRYRDVDNGTRATITAIDDLTGILTVEPDRGGRRTLDATYVAEHLEHAYALTGHGAQGATVEWAGVIGRPREFSAEWAYTALSRAREQTRLHLIAEPPARVRERLQFGPPELRPTLEEALNNARLAMMRREAERLAIEQVEPAELPRVNALAQMRLSLEQFAEARTEDAPVGRKPADPENVRNPPPEPDWRAVRRRRDRREPGLRLQR